MTLIYLILGLALTATFTWLLVRNARRSGLINGLLRIDTLLGIAAGIYLVLTSLVILLAR